jgi:hypothetical protein
VNTELEKLTPERQQSSNNTRFTIETSNMHKRSQIEEEVPYAYRE